MNGIIHQCSHPNDVDAHYRISEEKIFIDIFNYIDHLFTKIKPKKLFFMAVDGVAPRAKMNQQRSRRFRTAKEAADAIAKAKAKGEELPKEPPFDSNCITPGTLFMKKLSLQLEYFVHKKVSEDANWRNVEVILSGHEVPGEGEHKIMEYIRTAKAQPDYNPNVRHCLYGLDADLIMLGLLSHDPHFALLREEVTFGPRKKKKGGVESQNFYLMHISLLREYLDLEFSALRDLLPFDYDLERIIDDFVLLALFIGNDFVPHLPKLHIAEGALGLMFKVYKRILPEAGGYINDGGTLDMERLELMFKELSQFEREVFENDHDDSKWFKGKRKPVLNEVDIEASKRSNGFEMTPKQREIYQQIKTFVISKDQEALHFPPDYPARDRKFIQNLAADLGIRHAIEYHEVNNEKHVYVEFNSDSEDEDDSREGVWKKYEEADIVDDSQINTEAIEKQKYEERFDKWKKDYYLTKMGLDYDDSEQMYQLVRSYIEGLQWDLVRFKDLKFELGQPFRPFEQLMGVLPEGSKTLLPIPLQDLMVNPNSPIIDFYPKDFDTDMNGKKADWEAVVKIPFIDEERLIEALKGKEHLLTKEEKKRNSFKESQRFVFDENVSGRYPSPTPGRFPEINIRCRVETYNLPVVKNVELVKGLCDGVQLGAKAMAGFPSLETIPHSGEIKKHGVNVFNSESRNETIVITLYNVYENVETKAIAQEKIGKRIFVGWPFLQEGLVSAISDSNVRYELSTQADGTTEIIEKRHKADNTEQWKRRAGKLEHEYSKKRGTIIGTVNVLVHVRMLKGLKHKDDGSLVKEYLPPDQESDYAMQTVVENVECEDARYAEQPAQPISEEFPRFTEVFFLGNVNYGCPACVVGQSKKSLAVQLAAPAHSGDDHVFGLEVANQFHKRVQYHHSYNVAKKLGISGLALSKLTSSLHVICEQHRVNLGLNLKFEAKKQKVLGYTRKAVEGGWDYSDKAIELVAEYKRKFPEFIAALESKHKDEIYRAEDFYPQDVASAKIHEIKTWLNTVEVSDLERVSLDAEQLDKEAIAEIEKRAEQFVCHENDFKKIVVKNIPRQALLKPSHAANRLQDQVFRLGDRVVHVQDSGSAPIAAKGVVIGIDNNNIDVVFDVSFISGTTLGDRCSPYRGMTVLNSSLLNLSYRQYGPKYGRQADQRAKSSEVGRAQSNMNHSRGNNATHGRGNQSHNKQVAIAPRARGAPVGGINGRGYVNGHAHPKSSADGVYNRSRPYSQQGNFSRFGNAHFHDQFSHRGGYGGSRNVPGFVPGGRGASGHNQRGNGRGGTFPNNAPHRGRGRS
ncbi:11267_t:CDS:10 [Paraglomus occultum]|uniref:5'-3' exoribonuclease 1 n=1 Tax=Paraglomus occultum TaxID=144539 RepID=A0A9N8Z7U8_9GLOM|nr:11267_t:CDS:10 [Paraglomus occultum]